MGWGWLIRLAAPDMPSGATGGRASGVSCVLSSACMAVGVAFDEAGIELPVADWWDGSSWSVESMPSPAAMTDVFLNSVSCTSRTACTAIGGAVVVGVGRLFAEHWDGIAGRLSRSPAGRRDRCSAVPGLVHIAAGVRRGRVLHHFAGPILLWNAYRAMERSQVVDAQHARCPCADWRFV